MKIKRPKLLAINIILLIVASALTLYFSAQFVQVEREANAQNMGKFFGKMKEKFNFSTLKRNKKRQLSNRLKKQRRLNNISPKKRVFK